MPKMKHPESDQSIDVTAEQVSVYRGQGWLVVESPRKKAAKKKTGDGE